MARLSLCLLCLSFLMTVPAAAQQAVRSTALVDLNFDEPAGVAQDRATAGVGSNDAVPVGEPARVPSPFPGDQGRAVRLDSARGQFYQIADAPDLNHPAGTTLSLFFLSLHQPTDAVTYGVAAKRKPDGQGSNTNYGINFAPKSGQLQVYINDGTGFKVTRFPLAEAIGVRRRVHLSATFRHGDAPAPDDDTDADDLEIRLFVNGKPLAPTDSAAGFVAGEAAWIKDVNFAGLLSDTPLTVGASFPGGEPANGVIDDFLLFNRPLSAEEAATLFQEVAGPDAAVALAADTAAAVARGPSVTDFAPRGLQIGGTTRLTISGRQLGEGRVDFSGLPFDAMVLPESSAERLLVDVTVPADAVPTVAALAVQTPAGRSEPLPVPIERLPQFIAAAENTQSLPAAFTGRLAGAERPRWSFEGKAGAIFVAEVEYRRLGGTGDAVLELLSPAGTPLAIAWGSVEQSGDPRLTTTLPADDRYTLELHDLAYQAPAGAYRLIAGELVILDAVLPPNLAGGTTRPAIPLGVAVAALPLEIRADANAQTATLSGPAADAAHGPLPVVNVMPGLEIVEADAGEVIQLPADGTPLFLNGSIAAAGESDSYRIRGTAGRRLRISTDTAELASSVEPLITASAGTAALGRGTAKPGQGAVAFEVMPPADGEFTLQIADRLRGFGPQNLYRLRLAPADRPQFAVTAQAAAVQRPAVGGSLLRLQIERPTGTAEIRLIPNADSGLDLAPATVPAGKGTGEVFVTLVSTDQPGGKTFGLTAETTAPGGVLQVPVRFAVSAEFTRFAPQRPIFRVPIVPAGAVPLVEVLAAPPAAYKSTQLPVTVRVGGTVPVGQVLRLSLLSNEPTRPIDASKPDAGKKPLVRLAEGVALTAAGETTVLLLVPDDVAATQLDAVVQAEIVPHAYSENVSATGVSAPLRLPVREAVTKAEPVAAAALKPGANALAIRVERGEGFTQPLRVELRGLPAGFQAVPVAVPAEQSEVTLSVTVPAGAAVGAVPEAELMVQTADGALLKTVKPFPLQVVTP